MRLVIRSSLDVHQTAFTSSHRGECTLRKRFTVIFKSLILSWTTFWQEQSENNLFVLTVKIVIS